MPKLEVLIGMIASGKSTYARARAKEGALVVSHDQLTEMAHQEYRYEQGLRDCYRAAEESVVRAYLAAGRDVIVDRTHLTAESRRRWIGFARDYDAMNTFDGKGPRTLVVAVAFPARDYMAHAMRRFHADARGRSAEDWVAVARHHSEQARAEPLAGTEGFDCIVYREDEEMTRGIDGSGDATGEERVGDELDAALSADVLAMALTAGRETLVLDYTNHRGERGLRRVVPMYVEFAATAFHPEAQWLLVAFDRDKGNERSFAMADIHSMRKEST